MLSSVPVSFVCRFKNVKFLYWQSIINISFILKRKKYIHKVIIYPTNNSFLVFYFETVHIFFLTHLFLKIGLSHLKVLI